MSATSLAPIRGAVRADPRLADLWVEGEIGRVTVSSAGHAYFALKDERNQLQCVWFRDDRLRSAFEAQAGLRVVAHGRIDLFEPQGALQLYVESIQPAGFGDLALRFEALKARLSAEGLFDAARKRPLPTRPATIAVITSPTGAVWKDICHVLGRRWPLGRVVLVAAQVQGASAPASLVAAFRKVERYADEPDRGGAAGRSACGHDPRPRRWVARGPLGVQRRGGRQGRRRPSDPGGLRRRPRSGRHALRFRRGRSGADAVRRRRDRRARPGRLPRLRSAASDAAATWRYRDGSRRPGARSSPSGGRSIGSILPLSSSRRASGSACSSTVRRGRPSTGSRPTAGRRRGPASRLGPIVPAVSPANGSALTGPNVLADLATRRVGGARAALAATSSALGVLGPQATLERGYAIVRAADAGTIVRDPADAPPGTRLSLARGTRRAARNRRRAREARSAGHRWLTS